MRDGLIKVAAATPCGAVADCKYNEAAILKEIETAHRAGVKLLVLPELCVTGYTCGDLFLQNALLDAAETALLSIIQKTAGLEIAVVAGCPLRQDGRLYNCAAVFFKGTLLGVVPKSIIPNYGEFYEKRLFVPAPKTMGQICVQGIQAPFGTKLLFRCANLLEFSFAVEICEDLWAPVSPSAMHAQNGANIILNLSASNEVVTKNDYRKRLVSMQSAKLLCAYVYADAGMGESTTDLVYGGHNLIAENGALLCETPLFSHQMAVSEVDVFRLEYERRRILDFSEQDGSYQTVVFDMAVEQTCLTRKFPTQPFVPGDHALLARRCKEILDLQAHGLKKRMEHTKANTMVVGISGGLDSCLALLAAVRAADLMGRRHTDIVAVTMPCFGTSARTRVNAKSLCNLLGVAFREVDITKAVRQHFLDISQDEKKQDVTYENAQARMRTLVLMDIANQTGGLVVGTGDLSELALGWATYNGDHMSMYGVNASIPKTLVRHIVRHCADDTGDAKLKNVLEDILDTPVSPELLPADGTQPGQITEDLVGPYELHDFFLYYIVRWAYPPAKIYRLACRAFDGIYDKETVKKWQTAFYRRFFAQQFKRSCLPDGPKVGTVSLSPRGDFRMPSDACAAVWLEELEALS